MKKSFVVLAVAILSLCVWSYGDWSFPTNVSNSPNAHSQHPQVAFGPDGMVHMVYAEHYSSTTSDIIYTTYDGVSWSTPQKITTVHNADCRFPNITVDSKNNMAVIWCQSNEQWVRFYDATQGAWADPELVAAAEFGFGSHPFVALDDYDNIYCFYYGMSVGHSYARCKINGVWEDQFSLSNTGMRGKFGSIAASPDGTIWAVWMQNPGVAPGYISCYRYRTKDTPWSEATKIAATGTLEQVAPMVAIDTTTKNSNGKYIAYVVYMGAGLPEGNNWILMTSLNADTKVKEIVVPNGSYHYPRMAIDGLGGKHVAMEMGQGDHGTGIGYTGQAPEGGAWSPLYVFPDSIGWPRLPGISAEAFGNVAVVWDSITTGYYDAYFTSLYPVELKHFYAPTNLGVNISYSGAGSNYAVAYTLTWAANSENNDKYVKGYRIYYHKVGDQNWTALMDVDKNTLSQEIDVPSTLIPDSTQKIQFGISTIALSGYTGNIAPFYSPSQQQTRGLIRNH
jgi:hypothetical protein